MNATGAFDLDRAEGMGPHEAVDIIGPKPDQLVAAFAQPVGGQVAARYRPACGSLTEDRFGHAHHSP